MVDSRQVNRAFAELAKRQKTFPKDKSNPLIHTMEWYRQQLRSKWLPRRPSVSRSGNYQGDRWPGFREAYVSHVRADGTVVDAFGNTPRVRAGVVTNVRQGPATQRKASTLIGGQRAAGFGAVKKGQKFTNPNVLGRLKPDGSRLKSTDKQLGDHTDGMIKDFVTNPLSISSNGKTVSTGTNKPYAQIQAKRRAFHWTAKIGRAVKKEMLKAAKLYIAAPWGKNG